jgi:copper chaperone
VGFYPDSNEFKLNIMNTTKISIENLKCHGCAATIKKGIHKFPQVKQVEVDVENSLVSIDYDGEEILVGDFKQKLAQLGYPETGHNSGLKVAKSFVSCAVGRLVKE